MTKQKTENEPTGNPVLLLITKAERDESGKFPPSNVWLNKVQNEANLQGVTIEVRDFEIPDRKAMQQEDYPYIIVDLTAVELSDSEVHNYFWHLRQASLSSLIIATSIDPTIEMGRAALKHGTGANDFIDQSLHPHAIKSLFKPLLKPSSFPKKI
jgi:hypothetical protein